MDYYSRPAHLDFEDGRPGRVHALAIIGRLCAYIAGRAADVLPTLFATAPNTAMIAWQTHLAYHVHGSIDQRTYVRIMTTLGVEGALTTDEYLMRDLAPVPDGLVDESENPAAQAPADVMPHTMRHQPNLAGEYRRSRRLQHMVVMDSTGQTMDAYAATQAANQLLRDAGADDLAMIGTQDRAFPQDVTHRPDLVEGLSGWQWSDDEVARLIPVLARPADAAGDKRRRCTGVAHSTSNPTNGATPETVGTAKLPRVTYPKVRGQVAHQVPYTSAQPLLTIIELPVTFNRMTITGHGPWQAPKSKSAAHQPTTRAARAQRTKQAPIQVDAANAPDTLSAVARELHSMEALQTSELHALSQRSHRFVTEAGTTITLGKAFGKRYRLTVQRIGEPRRMTELASPDAVRSAVLNRL